MNKYARENSIVDKTANIVDVEYITIDITSAIKHR